ncbi:hypothetical protein, partial [Escherichia coli]|uniref:hypothetical protein n=1 Tax=Escherichia coli TaxID=562 RepID=UPI001BC8613C
ISGARTAAVSDGVIRAAHSLPRFAQTGQQSYAHGEAIVNYLARKEAATHSGRRRKGETRKLDYALLGWA